MLEAVFVSDVHLRTLSDPLGQLFSSFLEQLGKETKRLYILGDLFDAWIDDADPRFQSTLEPLLKSLPAEVYFLHGNRDFLVGPAFAKRANFTLLPDPCHITINQQSVVLTHGDLLCTQDVSYLRYRAFMRHPIIRKLIAALSFETKQAIANWLRKKSKTSVKKKSANILAITPSAAENMLNHFNASTLIHGHIHQAGIHEHPNQARRIVLGDWGKMGSYITLDRDNNFHLHTFS